MNAQRVSVNAKAIQPSVRSDCYWVYEVNGKKVSEVNGSTSECPKSKGENVRSEREKYACFELCLSLQGGETYCFCHFILFAHVSVRLSVHHKITPRFIA